MTQTLSIYPTQLINQLSNTAQLVCKEACINWVGSCILKRSLVQITQDHTETKLFGLLGKLLAIRKINFQFANAVIENLHCVSIRKMLGFDWPLLRIIPSSLSISQ
jgi:hypothetical protein